MRDPDRSGSAEGRPSSEERRRAMRAAFLRPLHLLVVAIGAVAFAFTLDWRIVPLTLAVYAALAFPAYYNETRMLEGRQIPPTARLGPPRNRDNVSPERRARWLPRGETRRKVEEALEVRRRTVFAIQESDDVTRAVLGDAASKLDLAAERLVDVAEKREKVNEAIRDLDAALPANAEHREGRGAELEELKKELRAADAEISDIFERLSTLRARVVRVSVESGGAAQSAAAELNADLDELNLRLDALKSTMLHPDEDSGAS